MLKQEKPQIFFMQETKCNSNTIGNILSKAWPGCHTVAVDAQGASGGLAIAWNPQTISLTNFHASHHLIQATFHIVGTNIHGHLTNVYFPQDAMSKSALLNTIASLNQNRIHPLWLIGGDFNMITKLEDKRGGRHKLEIESSLFKDFIQNQQLIDMQFCNGSFTWSNRRTGRQHIASKLDRFLISDNAIHIGGDLSAAILPLQGSDHWPISLQWLRMGQTSRRPFRFEAFWLNHHAFKDLITSTWKKFVSPEGSEMYKFQQKLKHLKGQIKLWNHSTFGNIFQAQRQLHQEMATLQQKIILEGYTDQHLEKEQQLRMQMEERAKQEEILWKQKSRIRWLKEGEKNTKFFHRSTIQRRMNNNITFIKNTEGEKVEEHEQIEQVLLNHFQAMHQEPQ